jgi:hypothetical protein
MGEANRGTAHHSKTAPVSAFTRRGASFVRVCTLTATSLLPNMVPEVRLELTRACAHRCLRPTRLPIPPLRHWYATGQGM